MLVLFGKGFREPDWRMGGFEGGGLDLEIWF